MLEERKSRSSTCIISISENKTAIKELKVQENLEETKNDPWEKEMATHPSILAG